MVAEVQGARGNQLSHCDNCDCDMTAKTLIDGSYRYATLHCSLTLSNCVAFLAESPSHPRSMNVTEGECGTEQDFRPDSDRLESITSRG